MMSRKIPTKWRDEFMAATARAGLRIDQARQFMRYAATMQRYAEAQCNGDWPADNGERPVKECSRCARLWAPEVLDKAGVCRDCRNDDRVKAALPEGWTCEMQGDPRGYVLKLLTPEGREIGVPS